MGGCVSKYRRRLCGGGGRGRFGSVAAAPLNLFLCAVMYRLSFTSRTSPHDTTASHVSERTPARTTPPRAYAV
eukprot:4457693-Pyramimonas_sp.AAC.1